MQFVRNIFLCTIVALCVPVAQSHAQQAKPKASKANMAKAKNHYHRAQSYKRLGEHQKAAEEYLKAYELYKDAEFYFNAAEMYRLAGDRARAVEYFQKYLVAHPDGRVSKAAKASVAKLASEIEAAGNARRAEQEAAAKARAAQDQAQKDARAKADAAREARQADTERRQKQEQKPSTASSAPASGKPLKIAGIASGAVGVVSLALGLKFGLDASSASDELSAKYDPQLESDGQAAESKMFVFYGIGAVAILGGGVLYYLGHGRSNRAEGVRALSVAPQVDGKRATLWVQGRF